MILGPSKCSLHWAYLEKWLIQFWNPLLMGINHRICDFPNFSAQEIIPNIVGFQVCSLYWGHLEKWLIQFWNPLLMGTNHRVCNIPNLWCNNSKDCSISGMFSALGHLEKWLIQFLNPLIYWEQSYDMWFSEFFNMVEYFQWNDISLPGKSWVRFFSEYWYMSPNYTSGY